MKYFILFVVTAFCLSACKTDLTDIEKRIDEVEKQGKELEEANKKLQEESERLKQQGNEISAEAQKRREENEKIQQRLKELGDSLNTVEPILLSMEFVAADNPLQLVENTPCIIIGDSVVECRILNITDDKELIPRFTFQGSVVTINGVEAESGVTRFDFSGPVVLSVITAKDIKDYHVYVNSYTGLPSVWLDTNSHVTVTNENQYYGGKIKVINNLATNATSNVTQANVKIMGLSPLRWYRPDYTATNSTEMLPAKNAYMLRFNNNVSLFSDPVGQSWKVNPDNNDLSFLHDQTAYDMGRISNLDYTPRSHHVDLFINSRYFGTYVVTERPEISEGRVNIGNDGFILCVGSDESGQTIYTNYLGQPVTILAPATPSESAYSYVASFVIAAETALFSDFFTDTNSGWQRYMDIDSFVDWYLINEIAKNPFGAFAKNCVMNLQKEGKLKMGPLLDFEEAFGNGSQTSATGFVIKDASWFARLFQDPAFVAKVKERFAYFYDHRMDIIADINANAQYLKYAVRENDNRWGVFDSYRGYIADTGLLYDGLVGSMKNWLMDRMDWLKNEFDAMA